MGFIERLAESQAAESARKVAVDSARRTEVARQLEAQREARLQFEAETAEITSLLEVVGAKEQLEKVRDEVWGDGIIEARSTGIYYQKLGG